MAFIPNPNNSWARGPKLGPARVNQQPQQQQQRASTPTQPESTPPPVGIPGQPINPLPTPTVDVPLPAGPANNYQYQQRLGSAPSGGEGFVWDPANYRRPQAPPQPTPPGGQGGNDPNKPLPPGGGSPAPTPGPVYGGRPDSGRGDGRDTAPVPPVPAPGQPAPGGQPPVTPGTPPVAGAPRPPRPPRPQLPGQVSQQAAQALYSQEFGAIPHEFKGQLMDLARAGNAHAFNQALFNSGIPHEMKLRLQQLFGFGAPAPAPAPGPVAQPQGVPQPPPAQPQGAVVPENQPGSPYYGAY